jgi:hypothetical protein
MLSSMMRVALGTSVRAVYWLVRRLGLSATLVSLWHVSTGPWPMCCIQPADCVLNFLSPTLCHLLRHSLLIIQHFSLGLCSNSSRVEWIRNQRPLGIPSPVLHIDWTMYTILRSVSHFSDRFLSLFSCFNSLYNLPHSRIPFTISLLWCLLLLFPLP